MSLYFMAMAIALTQIVIANAVKQSQLWFWKVRAYYLIFHLKQ